MVKNYLIIRYEDLSNEKQLKIDDILDARAKDIVRMEIESGDIAKDDFYIQVNKLTTQMINNIWVELEV